MDFALFARIFTLVYSSIPGIVHTIQAVAGDKVAGASKNQMAMDALGGAANTAATVLTGGNAQLAQVAAGAVMMGIQAEGAIASAVTAAKGTPAFTAATAKGNALQAQLATLAAATGSAAPAAGTSSAPASDATSAYEKDSEEDEHQAEAPAAVLG